MLLAFQSYDDVTPLITTGLWSCEPAWNDSIVRCESMTSDNIVRWLRSPSCDGMELKETENKDATHVLISRRLKTHEYIYPYWIDTDREYLLILIIFARAAWPKYTCINARRARATPTAGREGGLSEPRARLVNKYTRVQAARQMTSCKVWRGSRYLARSRVLCLLLVKYQRLSGYKIETALHSAYYTRLRIIAIKQQSHKQYHWLYFLFSKLKRHTLQDLIFSYAIFPDEFAGWHNNSFMPSFTRKKIKTK